MVPSNLLIFVRDNKEIDWGPEGVLWMTMIHHSLVAD
jgi:hypothetical protein